MATDRILKPSKWFSNKSLRLSLHRRKSRNQDPLSPNIVSIIRSSNSTLSSPRSPSPMSPCTTPKNNGVEDCLREVFHHFDVDRDGKISAYELRSYFGSIGEHMSHEEAQGVINDLDSDGDNLLDFKDFTKLMKKERGDGYDEEEDLKKAFDMFVWEKEECGCITPKGLQRMLHRLGDDKSYDECVAMINAFDNDHNGVLDFSEFYQMMT